MSPPASSRYVPPLPTGPSSSCRSWLTEAPFRMLQNNLDPEVAEGPEDLVVYGGSGKAARDSRNAATRILADAARRSATTRRCSSNPGEPGRRLPDARRRAAGPDRELEPGRRVGELGGVPRARGDGPDDVRPDDGGLLDLHRDAGDPAGDVRDVRRVRRPSLRRIARGQARRHRQASAGWAARSRSPPTMTGGDLPRRRGRSRAHREAHADRATSTRRTTASTPPSTGRSTLEDARAARSPSASVGNVVDLLERLRDREIVPDVLTDQTSAHDPLEGYVPHGLSLADAARAAAGGSGRLHAREPRSDGRATSRSCSSSSEAGRSPSTTATTCAARRRTPAAGTPSTSRASCPSTSGRSSARAGARSAGSRSRASRPTSTRPTASILEAVPAPHVALPLDPARERARPVPGPPRADLLAGLRRSREVRAAHSTTSSAPARSRRRS